MHIEHNLSIEAPAEVVWDLTTDLEAWPSMTPTMTAVDRLDEGPLRVGSSARVKQPGQRPTVWTVTRLEEPTTFAWSAKVLGITMTALHRITPQEAGCRNTLSVDLTGRGSGLIGRVIGRQVSKAIATENQGFKARAEATR